MRRVVLDLVAEVADVDVDRLLVLVERFVVAEELEELGPGTAGVATYTYARGMALKTLVLNAQLESKIAATLTFCAKDIQDPVLAASRATGASTPRSPMAAALFHTASPQLQKVRLATSAGTTLAAEVNSWQFTM